ncbi:MAG: hypothetical protein WBI45_08615 [Defluviitoga tunisiensis]
MFIVYDKTTGEIVFSVEENAIDVYYDTNIQAALEITERIRINEWYVEDGMLKRKKNIEMSYEIGILHLTCDKPIGNITLKIINRNQLVDTFNLDIESNTEDIEIEKSDNDQYMIVLEGHRVVEKVITI